MNTRFLALATLALCAAQPLSAQSDQSKPSAHNPAQLDKTAPPAGAQANQNSAEKKNEPTSSQATAQTDATRHQAAQSSDQSRTAAAQPPQQQQTQTPAATAAANTASTTPRPNIQIAADDAKNRTAERYIGWRVKSSDRGELGKVKDFLIDTQTGKAEFALISSGGFAGVGDKLRLVPTTALKRLGESNDFMLEIQKNRWDSLATVDEKEIESGRVTVPDSQRRQIAQHFQHSTGTTQDTGAYTASLTAHLVPASDVAGRNVQAGNDKLGKIDHVVLDLDSGMAQALVDPDKHFTGLKDKLLVPFNALTIGEGKHPQVSTLLSRADFQQLRSGTQMAAASPATPPSAVAAAGSPSQQQRETASPSSEQAKATSETAPSQNVASTTQPASQQPAPTGRTEMPQKGSQVASTETSSKPAATARSANEPSSSSSEKSAVASSETPPPSSSQTTERAGQKLTDRSGRVAQTDKSAANKDENLTPTGRSSEDAIPAGADPALLATARAIRKALDEDEALRGADVRVTPENGKIVLRGRVSDQKTKTAILETATREVKGWKFDDQITIDNR